MTTRIHRSALVVFQSHSLLQYEVLLLRHSNDNEKTTSPKGVGAEPC